MNNHCGAADNTSQSPKGGARLRLIFKDAILCYDLGDRPSLGDIAFTLSSASRSDMPMAIDVSWLDTPPHGRRQTSVLSS